MLEVKIAENSEEKNLAYHLRYKVFCEELNYLDKALYLDKRESDEYDSLNTTFTFIALDNLKAVGTSRLIRQNKNLGMPIEKFYDFSHYLIDERIFAENSRSIVLPEYRKTRLIFDIWSAVTQFALENKISHYCTTCHTKDIKMYSKLGFEVIGSKIKCSYYNNNPMVPLILEIERMREPFKSSFLAKRDYIKI